MSLIINKINGGGVSYSKLIKPIPNSYWENNEGCCIVGTPFSPDYLGKNIAEYIYKNFSIDNIDFFQRQILGIWATFICKNGFLYCFTDYYGIYEIFYTVNKEEIIISTSMSDLLHILPDLEFNKFEFILENFIGIGRMHGKTQFKNIISLKDNSYIKINLKGNLWEIKNFEKNYIKYKYINEERALEFLKTKLLNYSYKLGKEYERIGILMTGGLDSRLIYGIFEAGKCNILNIHGIGNGTCKQDYDIVKKISNNYNVELQLLDWHYEKNLNLDNQKEVFSEIGFLNWIDAGSKIYYDELRKILSKIDFLQAGYLAECFRLREYIENKGKDYFSLFEYIDEYCLSNIDSSLVPDIPYLKNELFNLFNTILKEQGFNGDLNKIHINHFERFRWSLARIGDSQYQKMINIYIPSFPILGIPYIHECVLSLPAEIIKHGSFQIKLLEKIDPKLIKDYKIFSHRREYNIKNYRKVKDFSLRNFASSIINIAPFLSFPLHYIYQSYKGMQKNEAPVDTKNLEFLNSIFFLNSKSKKFLNKKTISLFINLYFLKKPV